MTSNSYSKKVQDEKLTKSTGEAEDSSKERPRKKVKNVFTYMESTCKRIFFLSLKVQPILFKSKFSFHRYRQHKWTQESSLQEHKREPSNKSVDSESLVRSFHLHRLFSSIRSVLESGKPIYDSN